ncbi:MAG: hypothetical protein OEX80_02390 [Candidatus Aminicenantes bacterium]|nr:hypothetical protein [Candidatus Aminicenantes bacterium]
MRNFLHRREIGLMLSFIIVLCFAVTAFCNQETSEQKLKEKTFTLRFRDLNEATLKIRPFVSNQGSILIRPQQKQLVVKDLPYNLDKIEQVIRAFDFPPKRLIIAIHFIEASKVSQPGKVSVELEEVANRLSGVLNFNHYELVDRVIMRAVEGENFRHQAGNRYFMSFYGEFIDDGPGVIKLRNFTLFKSELLPNGKYRYKKLFSSALNLINQQTIVVGASKSELSNRALLMVITAKVQR